MRAVFAFALSAVVVGCGSTGGVATAGNVDCQSDGAPYPTGKCGYNKGQTIENLVFSGKTGGASAPSQTVKLADLYDPNGAAGRRLLLVDVSALWCQACKGEAAAMPQLESDYAGKGMVFMTVLAEGNSTSAATPTDVDTWINAYKLQSLVVNDPTLSTEAFFDRAQMPFNMLVDLRSMTIVWRGVGYDDAQLRAQLDAALAN
jgi:hypothetical protein